MDTLLISMLIGVLAGVPAWIVWQRAGARRGLVAARGFDPRDAVPCRIEPVVLNARLVPDVDAAPKDASRP
ncbi:MULTISPECIES: hypothetical protein [Caballeronia]|jgi:hypothetical protein|uniref:hypothetical protein n=1 Tax=Caballeronia TaxID=1827195 RepID=UPI00158D2368|nr:MULTISPECIES: hypothetical protein [Caballeronia]MCG7403335.1 hypothetical protein [Caballeronia zhejiangensis]MCI1044854.1 hypothetical protein [Caballeronia zhejiangensis]MDR5794749.1 hypothetical protein [Caballeronia sp. LZ008]